MNTAIVELAKDLISRPSVSPNDEGCQLLIISQLKDANFDIEKIDFADTENMLAWHGNRDNGPTLLFAGHTDVVPAGNGAWQFPPFQPTVHNGMLYGRGAADMKGALAAITIACKQFCQHYPDHKGRIGLLITSDEEASAVNGTIKVVELLQKRAEKIDYCLVGEPSSQTQLGDVIKNGRRGSITANLTIQGVQGHVAYPDLACNPIHQALQALADMVTTTWDNGNDFFPATSMQITNMQAGTGAENVIPAQLCLQFNFRFSSELTPEKIKENVAQLLDRYQLNYQLQWRLSGLPFLTPHGRFTDIISQAITQQTGIIPMLSTSGGTSDGRFIAQLGCEVVEFGPLNATIHKIDECISLQDLHQLGIIYYQIMKQLLL